MAWLSVIDVSEHQGVIDWHKVKRAGIDGAYIRYCNGITIDKRAIVNAYWCRTLKIPFGFYCYWHPMFRADRQAKLLIKGTREQKATWIPMLDVEDADDQKPRVIISKLLRSVKVITAAFNKPPTIYTAAWFWNIHVKSLLFSNCPLWVARYVHYSREAFRQDPIPADPAEWPEYSRQQKRPVPVIGWQSWCAWQFAGGYDNVGARYGMQSSDLDLNILKTSQIHRYWLTH